MELRETFNEDAANYDRYRPTYPPELFRDIFAYSGIGRGSALVEIGVGTGQATKPFLEAGCEVCGVELGDKLSAFAAGKFRAYDNFTVHCGDFMEFPLEDASVDLVYAATAFHWLPQEAAYDRTLEPELRQRFEDEMREAINAVGGSIRIYDTVDLYLARNP